MRMFTIEPVKRQTDVRWNFLRSAGDDFHLGAIVLLCEKLSMTWLIIPSEQFSAQNQNTQAVKQIYIHRSDWCLRSFIN